MTYTRRSYKPENARECQEFMAKVLEEHPMVLEFHDLRGPEVCNVPARTVYKATGTTYPFKVWLDKTLSKRGLVDGVNYRTLHLDPSIEENADEIAKGRGTLVFFTAKTAHNLAKDNDDYLDALCSYYDLKSSMRDFELKNLAEQLRIIKAFKEEASQQVKYVQDAVSEFARCLENNLNKSTQDQPQGEQA